MVSSAAILAIAEAARSDPDELPDGPLLRPIMVRLADEGVPLLAIARSLKVPLQVVHATIGAALSAARLLQSPPADWPPGQPSSQRNGRPVHLPESELTTALQHRYQITRQQALLLVVLLKRERATKEVLYAAAQAVHAPNQETTPKLVDVVICKLRKRMKKHGYTIETIWNGGYYLIEAQRRAILAGVGVTLADITHTAVTKVPVPSVGVRRRA